MLGFVSELAAFEHPEDFREGVLPGLRELVPCDVITYNEVEFDAGRMIAADDPPGSMSPRAPELFVQFGHQNPIVSRYQQTRDGRPVKWSDFITRRDLHATDLYREIYAPMGVEFQMAFCLPAPAELVIGLALNRGTRDFGERDRRLLNLIRAPMIQAYRMVERYAAAVSRLEALERGLERGGAGVIVLERGGAGLAPGFVSSQAATILGLETAASGESTRLPNQISDWLSGLASGSGDATAFAPLIFTSAEGVQVTLRFLPARGTREADVVLVEPTVEPLSIATLRAAGLTPREAEVLRLVAFGKTDHAIATALGVSPRTIHKHLQNVYDKLGATSRTQALLTAWSIDRGTPIAARAGSERATG